MLLSALLPVSCVFLPVSISLSQSILIVSHHSAIISHQAVLQPSSAVMAVILLDILSHLVSFLSILSFTHFAMAAPVDPRQSQPPNNTVDDGAKGGVPAFAIQQSTSDLPVYVRDYGLSSIPSDDSHGY